MKLFSAIVLTLAVATCQAKIIPLQTEQNVDLYAGLAPFGIIDDIINFLKNLDKYVNEIIAKLPPVLELPNVLDAQVKFTDVDVKGLKDVKASITQNKDVFEFELTLPQLTASIVTSGILNLPDNKKVTLGGPRKLDVQSLKLTGKFGIANNQITNLGELVPAIGQIDLTTGVPLVDKFIKEHIQKFLKTNQKRISTLISSLAQDSINEYAKILKIKLDTLAAIKAALEDFLKQLPEEIKVATLLQGGIKFEDVKISGLNKGKFSMSKDFDWYALEAPELAIEGTTKVSLNGDGYVLGEKWTYEHNSAGNKITTVKPKVEVKVKIPPSLDPVELFTDITLSEESAKHELKDVKFTSGSKTIDTSLLNKFLDEAIPAILKEKQAIFSKALAAFADLTVAVAVEVAQAGQ